ncbi:hypothetical protein RQP46_008724 [Phenoliferia psychrophenolica]
MLLRRVMSSTSSSLLRYANPTLNHLAAAVEVLTPLSLAESAWDNVGLMVEAPKPRLVSQGPKRVVCCIDLTTAVVTSALADPSTSAILTYHPPIFSGLKSLRLDGSSLQASLLHCIAEGVPVFCVHTAADNCLNGTNDFIAQGLLAGSKGGSARAIKLSLDPPVGHEGAGSGRIVEFGEELEKAEVVRRVKQVLGLQYLQAAWASEGPELISTAAVCAGSGSSVLKDVKTDIWVTGEASHHDVLAANAKGVHILLSNHSASERPWLASFAPRLADQMNKAAGVEGAYEVVCSKADREPLQVV